jgi:hypothetical protein
MAEAKMHKGKAIVAYRNGQAIDSDGNVIEGAPKPPKDTPASEQIGRAGALSPEERMAAAVAAAVINPQAALARAQAVDAATAAPETDDEDEGTSDAEEEEGMPTLADLPAHLDSMTNADEIKAMRRQDVRKGAKPMYKARLDALAAE